MNSASTNLGIDDGTDTSHMNVTKTFTVYGITTTKGAVYVGDDLEHTKRLFKHLQADSASFVTENNKIVQSTYTITQTYSPWQDLTDVDTPASVSDSQQDGDAV